MKKPDFKTCTEEELWVYVGFHLAQAGIATVLVGGAVVSVYSGNLYRSGDLDLIADVHESDALDKALRDLGFLRQGTRRFIHPECLHIFLEFLPGPVSIGRDIQIRPDTRKVGTQVLRILNPTDCIRDRLASYIHFQARDCLEQARLVAKAQPWNRAKVRTFCRDEGRPDVYSELTSE